MSRARDDRGSAMVTGAVLMFAFTAGAVISLSRDVDRALSERATAQAIAFQAARSGAQQVDVDALRVASSPMIAVDPGRAGSAATVTATRLFEAYLVTGRITSIDVAGDRVTVAVEIETMGQTVTGIGSAQATGSP